MGYCRDWIVPQNYRNPFREDVSPPAPIPRGKCPVVVHCLTSDGQLNGAQEVIVSGQRNEDGGYNQDMSFEFYSTWFTRLAENLQTVCGSNRVVVVLDNAPYHSKKLDWIPTSANTKQALASFLQQHDIPFDVSWTKKSMLRAICQHIAGKEEQFQSYVIDKIAQDREVEILRLPPFRCQFSSIELFWSWLRREVPKKAYQSIKVEELKDLTLQVDRIAMINHNEARMSDLHGSLCFRRWRKSWKNLCISGRSSA